MATRGIVSVKVEPAADRLSSVMSPPSRRARWRLIDRPRPVPPCWRVLLLSTWRNSSNISSSASAGMPMPVSATARRSGLCSRGPDRDAAGFGELGRVAEQVEQDLAELVLIGVERRQAGLDLLLEPDARP